MFVTAHQKNMTARLNSFPLVLSFSCLILI